MTPGQYEQFLTAVALICALGAMFNISKIPSRRASAQYLAGAFICMGVGAFLIRQHASQIFIAIAGGATFGLLAADVVYRLRNPGKRLRK